MNIFVTQNHVLLGLLSPHSALQISNIDSGPKKGVNENLHVLQRINPLIRMKLFTMSIVGTASIQEDQVWEVKNNNKVN